MTITVLPWRHDSELAFVRDCFYPQHVPSSSATKPDIYTTPASTDVNLHFAAFATDTSALTASDSSGIAKIKNYKSALQRVSIWTFRSARSVPHAVTATAALIDARLHDECAFTPVRVETVFDQFSVGQAEHLAGVDINSGSSSVTLSESAMKSIYAMAFIRFVNGFVDRDVSRSSQRTGLSGTDSSYDYDPDNSGDEATPAVRNVGESSMYAFADVIKMPREFVALRHHCVHGVALPRLTRLRTMTDKALEWLWRRWWEGNALGDAGRWIWEVENERSRQIRRDHSQQSEEIDDEADT